MALQINGKRWKCKEIGLYLPDHVSLTSSGIFYFRYVLPTPLRVWLCKREIKASLGRDYSNALQLAWQYNKFIQIVRHSWRKAEAVIGVDDNERREIARKIALNMMFGVNDIGNFYDPSMVVWMSQQSALSLSQNFQNTWAMLLQDADPADIQRGGITPALLDHMKQQLQSQAVPAKKLSDVIEDWIAYKKRSGSGDKSLNAYQTIKQELCWAFGSNTDITALTSDDLKDYGVFWQSKDPLLTYRMAHKLSMRAVKDGKYPNGVSPRTDELLDAKTKINKLIHIRNFFRWCYDQDYLPVDFSRKLHGLGLKAAKNANTNPPLSD